MYERSNTLLSRVSIIIGIVIRIIMTVSGSSGGISVSGALC